MDRGAWQATVYGVAKTQTRLKQLNMHMAYTDAQLTQVLQLSGFSKQHTTRSQTPRSEHSPAHSQKLPLLLPPGHKLPLTKV